MEKKKTKRNKIELPVNQIICDHNVRAMRKFSNNSVDGIVTDPPYALGFMGKGWDKVLPNPKTWTECLRVAKPGAFMLVFGGTRTFHRLTCAIEDAGWQIRDCLMWLYGSGFPKSHNISKAIDKAAGQYVKGRILPSSRKTGASDTGIATTFREKTATNPQTDLAKLWDGYGTVLKPAWEPIIVAMKPVDDNFAKNAEKYGVAGLNIDGGRIGTIDDLSGGNYGGVFSGSRNPDGSLCKAIGSGSKGRWPANLILVEESAKMLDKQAPSTGAFAKVKFGHSGKSKGIYGDYEQKGDDGLTFHNDGLCGASRFFYIAKASRDERNAGLSGTESRQVDEGRKPENPGGNNPRNRGARKDTNFHPTVKPLQLMQYLCMLLKMPNKEQIILDPFVGSGTTCIACKELGINYIGIDNNKDYCELARKRLENVKPRLFEKPEKKMSKKIKESFGLV